MTWFSRFKIKRMLKQIKSMHHYRKLNQPTDQAIHQEISLYFKLAHQYEALHGHKKYPFAYQQALACYRAAASLDDAQAQFILGKKLLEEAKLRETLEKNEIFSSKSNEHDMKRLYEDAHAFLEAANKKNHIQAKRILGLCYIHGWGVKIDKEFGFDLIVASIDQENSWDRVQKVFAEIGINKPQFFSELFKHRYKK